MSTAGTFCSCPSLKTITTGALKSMRAISAISRVCRCPSLKTMAIDPGLSAGAAAFATLTASMIVARIEAALRVLRMVFLLQTQQGARIHASWIMVRRQAQVCSTHGLIVRLRCTLRRFFQVSQHLSGMALSLYFGKDMLDLAIRSDDERGSDDAHDFLAIHVLFLEHAEGIGDFLVRIRQQRERQLEFLLELLLRLGRVGRDAK